MIDSGRQICYNEIVEASCSTLFLLDCSNLINSGIINNARSASNAKALTLASTTSTADRAFFVRFTKKQKSDAVDFGRSCTALDRTANMLAGTLYIVSQVRFLVNTHLKIFQHIPSESSGGILLFYSDFPNYSRHDFAAGDSPDATGSGTYSRVRAFFLSPHRRPIAPHRSPVAARRSTVTVPSSPHPSALAALPIAISPLSGNAAPPWWR